MIDTLLKTLSKLDAEEIRDTVRGLLDGSTTLTDTAGRAVSIVPLTAASADAVSKSLRRGVRRGLRRGRRQGTRLARQAGTYVVENPRQAGGIGLGTLAVAGAGAYLYYRLSKARAEDKAEGKAEAEELQAEVDTLPA